MLFCNGSLAAECCAEEPEPPEPPDIPPPNDPPDPPFPPWQPGKWYEWRLVGIRVEDIGDPWCEHTATIDPGGWPAAQGQGPSVWSAEGGTDGAKAAALMSLNFVRGLNSEKYAAELNMPCGGCCGPNKWQFLEIVSASKGKGGKYEVKFLVEDCPDVGNEPDLHCTLVMQYKGWKNVS